MLRGGGVGVCAKPTLADGDYAQVRKYKSANAKLHTNAKPRTKKSRRAVELSPDSD